MVTEVDGVTGGHHVPSAAAPESLAAVRQVLTAWINNLIDTSGRNPLLYFKPSGSVDLAGAEPRALKRLLLGEQVRLRELFPDVQEREPIAKTLGNLYKRIKAYDEELGVSIGRLTSGMVSWTERDQTRNRQPAAPLFLRHVTVAQPQRGVEDFTITVEPDVEVNEVLLHLFARDFHVAVPAGTIEELTDLASTDHFRWSDADTSFARDSALGMFERAAQGVEGLKVTPALFLGGYRYQKLPMVKDLQANGDLFAASDLVAAVAGSTRAIDNIRVKVGEVSRSDPNFIPPSDEFLVLDADPSQNYAINAALAGRNIIIQGPPGTGKSQTISNLISSFIARGKTVLFVAEKRAAIDAVTNRLNAVGLGGAILDLHDGAKNKASVNASIAEAIAAARAIPETDTSGISRTITRTRERLLTHGDALHRIREPWNESIFDLQAEVLATTPECQVAYRFPKEETRQLDSQTVRDIREILSETASLGAFLPLTVRPPWATARDLTEGNAMAAFDTSRTLASEQLPAALKHYNEVASETHTREQDSINAWTEKLQLHAQVTQIERNWLATVWEAELTDLIKGCAPRRVRKDKNWEVSWSTRRAVRKYAKTLQRPKAPKLVYYEEFTRILDTLTIWQSITAIPETTPVNYDITKTQQAHNTLLETLTRLSGTLQRDDLADLPLTDLRALLAVLSRDPADIMKTARINELLTRLKNCNLTGFLRELQPTAETWTASEANIKTVQAFAYTWANSVLDEITLHDSHFGAFDAGEHSAVAEQFAEADREHRDITPHRILRKVAENLAAIRNQHQDQDTRLEIELQRKRRIRPLRDIIEMAPDVAFAAKPCWAMSPLVVSQVLPANAQFDLVVFDEASQIRPADAIPSLGRAKQAVICGDSKQLPPTSAFLEADDDNGDGLPPAATSNSTTSDHDISYDNLGALTEDTESILDVFDAALGSTLASEYRLLWHYRSTDARLIAYSNAWFYDNSLMTFPGTTVDTPVEFVEVPHPAGQPQNVANEVQTVVDLIVQHALTQPDESLGVITMSIKHAQRIENALDERIRQSNDLDLQDFFRETAQEPFFIKNLERVQGDERDAIIISLGYIKEPDGRMLYRFGPINNKGGERRLNVAASRAKNRITLVSSFTTEDLNPNRLAGEGAKALRAYLQYAKSGGEDLGDKGASDRTLNPFEIHVRDRLVRAGIPVTPQYGVAGYFIDFAATHPTSPGLMVLAIEADGASYHSSETSRARDRLRQEHLERLGWTFHRIWSTDYFRDPDTVIEQTKRAYEKAIANLDQGPQSRSEHEADSGIQPSDHATPTRPKPLRVPKGRAITDYTDRQLLETVQWVASDGLLRTDNELLYETTQTLGFKRRGSRITERINHAIRLHARQ